MIGSMDQTGARDDGSAAPDIELLPSCSTGAWLWAGGALHDDDDRGGKWLVYAMPGEALDNSWRIIRPAVLAGELGPAAKASTGLVGHSRDGEGVICVYTSDWLDRPDVARVLRRLRALGFTGLLSYKRNADTAALDYRRGVAAYVSLPGSEGFQVRKKRWDEPEPGDPTRI